MCDILSADVKLAPVVVFVHDRLDHTMKTLSTLEQNHCARQTDVIVYSDGAAQAAKAGAVSAVRDYIRAGLRFKSVALVERETNWGLARNIIDGVTSVINRFGSVIVIEDDILTAPYFLTFMNSALTEFKNESRVMHISGYGYPISAEELHGAFYSRLMSCWGWATWADRWKYFEKDARKWLKEFNKRDIRRFNLDGAHDFWKQIKLNQKTKIDTWAIFWYATIFRQNGLCVFPDRTLVENIGFDGTGVHGGKTSVFSSPLSKELPIIGEEPLEENMIAFERIRRFYLGIRSPLFLRIVASLRRIASPIKRMLLN